jgi:hypothetical protein
MAGTSLSNCPPFGETDPLSSGMNTIRNPGCGCVSRALTINRQGYGAGNLNLFEKIHPIPEE